MFTFCVRALCAAAVFSSAAVVAHAQPTPTPSPSAVPEIAHVITSDRSYETLANAARTTYVVTRADMLRHGYLNVADAIATIPGVNVVRFGPGAAAASLNIRGGSSLESLVLINGEPAPGVAIDSVDLASIPTAGVDRIEVVEGGGSTLYGSGSVGGIVNIITTQAKGSVADVRTGSFGERDVRVQTPYVSFERAIGTDNFSLPDGTNAFNVDYSITNGRVAYAKSIGAIDAQFTAGITDRHQGVPGPFSFSSPTSRQDDVTRDAQLTLTMKHGKASTALSLYGSSLNLAFTCNTPVDPSCFNSFSFPLTPFAELLTDGNVGASLRTVIEEQASTLVAGVDVARGVVRVDDGSDPFQILPHAQVAAYAQDRWSLGNGNAVYAGVRGERDTTFGAASGGALSPSVGGIFRLANDLSLRINAATAFRAPTADELYFPFFSNPNLVPERTHVLDATITDDAIAGGISFGWFGIAGNNLIADDSSFIPQNVGHASIAGLTFTAKTRPVNGIYSALNVTNLYKAQDLDTDPALDVNAGQRIPSRGPVFQVNLELGYLSSSQRDVIDSMAIDVRTQGARGPVDPTAPLFFQPVTYSRVDAFVRVRAGSHALVTLRGFNLGNERYAEISGFPMPGRSFAVELSTR